MKGVLPWNAFMDRIMFAAARNITGKCISCALPATHCGSSSVSVCFPLCPDRFTWAIIPAETCLMFFNLLGSFNLRGYLEDLLCNLHVKVSCKSTARNDQICQIWQSIIYGVQSLPKFKFYFQSLSFIFNIQVLFSASSVSSTPSWHDL